jgi:hypothetical protein
MSFGGWIAHHGKLVVENGALVIEPDADSSADARVFLSHTGLRLLVPVTATLRVRAPQAGRSTMTWRSQERAEFIPADAVTFDWPVSTDWREVTIQIPVTGHLTHLRITPAKGSRGLAIQAIELRGQDSQKTWRFATLK